MKHIFIALIVSLSFASCNTDELEKLKNENSFLKNQIDSIRASIQKEEIKKKFFGEYINIKKGLYKSFDFKGETSVVLTDGIIGFPFATNYERDGNIIRVKTDKSDLILTIKDSNTIVGEGFSEGVYSKNSNKKEEIEKEKIVPGESRFLYTLKDKRTGELVEVEKWPENWEQKYDYISNRVIGE